MRLRNDLRAVKKKLAHVNKVILSKIVTALEKHL